MRKGWRGFWRFGQGPGRGREGAGQAGLGAPEVWETLEAVEAPDPEPRAEVGAVVRFGAWLLLAGFGGFLLWAMYAPLDEGVPVEGRLMLETRRKTVQHLTGGLVQAVQVREGQVVEAGQVLIRLDAAEARAEFESARQRYLGLRATEDRLLAEQQGLEAVHFHPDVLAGGEDARLSHHREIQAQLFASRRLALQSELASLAEAAAAQQASAAGLEAQRGSRQAQLDFLLEERDGLKGLVAEGYAPRNRLLELERQAAELRATLSDLLARQAVAQRSAAELGLRRQQRVQEFRREVDGRLAEVRREVSADEQRLKAAREALARTEIRAPVGGAVVGVEMQTVGGVIPPGARIMEIVPLDEPLLLEARIPPALIDRVRVGQVADIRFSSFAQMPHLVIEGELVSVSADLLPAVGNEAPYYLGRVKVTEQGLQALGNKRLQPGMPAEIVIKTGERSLLDYLLHPLTRRVAASMKEE